MPKRPKRTKLPKPVRAWAGVLNGRLSCNWPSDDDAPNVCMYRTQKHAARCFECVIPVEIRAVRRTKR